jgi:hypothetical protein
MLRTEYLSRTAYSIQLIEFRRLTLVRILCKLLLRTHAHARTYLLCSLIAEAAKRHVIKLSKFKIFPLDFSLRSQLQFKDTRNHLMKPRFLQAQHSFEISLGFEIWSSYK